MESRTPLPGVNERDGSVLGCGRMSCFGGRLVDQPRLLIFSAARGGREVCVMIGAVDGRCDQISKPEFSRQVHPFFQHLWS